MEAFPLLFMAANELELLFRLRQDSAQPRADVKSLRSFYASEFQSIQKTAAAALKGALGTVRGGQADAHVKEFRRIEAEAARSSKAQEREQARLNRAVESLQRQRSAAIISGLKAEERAAAQAAAAQQRAAQQAAQMTQGLLSRILPQFGQFSGLLGNVNGGLSSVTKGFAAAAAGALAIVAAVKLLETAFSLLVKVGESVVGILELIFERGVNYNSQLEQTRLGIGAVIAALAQLETATGKKLEGPAALNASLSLASDQLAKLKVDAVNTVATFEQIAPAFQAAIGPGLRAGLTLDQIRQTVVRITQAAGAIGLPFNQLNQEVRAILEGTINEDARLAKVLGISNELVKSWKEQGTLAEELQKRLEAFGTAGIKAAETMDGLRSNLQEALNVFTGEATTRAFEVLKSRVARILPQVFDFKAAGIDKSLKALAEIIDDIFVRVINISGEVVEQIVTGVKRVSQFLAENRQLVDDILKTSEDILRLIILYTRQLLSAAGSTKDWRVALELVHGTLFGIKLLLIGFAPIIKDATAAARILLTVLLAAQPALALLVRLAGTVPKTAEEVTASVLAQTTEGIAALEAALIRVNAAKKAGEDGKKKGEDAATRTRIRLLEVGAREAERIARNETEGLQVQYDKRLISVRELERAEIDSALNVLGARQKVYDAERLEAEKLKKGRELALAEINLKDREAQDEFTRAVTQANERRRKAEVEAERAHREAVLDLREQADERELARLEDMAERGLVTLHRVESRRAELEQAAIRRRALALATELKDAGVNEEKRREILDKLNALALESAAVTEESERRKRNAANETARAYLAYSETIRRAQEDAFQASRDAVRFELESLRKRLGDRRRLLRELFALESTEAAARHAEELRRIDERERAAEEEAKRVGDFERRKAEIERQFNDLRLAEDERFRAERRAAQEEQDAELDPFRKLKDRWENFKEDIRNTNDAIAESIKAVSDSIDAALDNMRDALKQSIAAWILYGGSLGKALKAALAQQLASIAAEAGVRALYHAAWALGSLAFGDFAGAAKHGLAAAAFGALAAGAGVAARGFSRSSGLFDQGKTASAAVGGGGSAAEGPRQLDPRDLTRPTVQPAPVINVYPQIHMTGDLAPLSNFVTQTVVQDVAVNGPIRGTIINTSREG